MNLEKQKRRTWAEVSLTRLNHNYCALRELLAPGCRFMGMVKADAYGHGAINIAHRLQALGADYLGVACLDEALELRAHGITMPILVLGRTVTEDMPLLLRHELAQAVFDMEDARAISAAAQAAGKGVTVHIKVDTGMSRLGFPCGEDGLGRAAEQIAAVCALPGLSPEGIFTHFADSDGDEGFTMEQLVRFLDLLNSLEEQGCRFPIRHCANSAATILYPSTHLDMVRSGIALYGHYPGQEMEALCPLLPVMEVRSRVISVKTAPKGSAVSYGRTHRLTKDKRLAVVPIGYGDGFPRGLSNKGAVQIHGCPAPILGRVCMDMCMVDISEIPEAKPGDEVVVYSRQRKSGCTIEDAAEQLNTISYELLCALSKRIPRIDG